MQRVTPLDLTTVSIRSIPGITPEDTRELQGLNLGSVKSVMDAFDAHDGDLSLVSTNAIVIDSTQSDRIAAGLLAHTQVPASWKSKWVPVQLQTNGSESNGTVPSAQQQSPVVTVPQKKFKLVLW